MAGRTVTNWAPPIPKVTALITRPGGDGPELLVFDHGLAGIQLPAGTVEEGESFAAAVLREGWEETGALGLELVRELAVTHYKFGGRTGAVVRDVVAHGRVYPRGNHLSVLRVDGDNAVTDLWDGTPIELADESHRAREERHIFHLRATVEMPDEWFVVTPDGGGTDWWCFWVPLGEAHGLLHEYQRDWLDAVGPRLVESTQEAPPTRARSPLPADFHDATVWENFIAPPVDRRYALAYFDDCDEEACSRAHGLCVTEDGQVVLVKESNGFWDLPGGGKERGESTAENFAREIWEEVCRACRRLPLPDCPAPGRARRAGRPDRTGRAPCADVGARRARAVGAAVRDHGTDARHARGRGGPLAALAKHARAVGPGGNL